MKKLALYKCFNPRTHTGCDLKERRKELVGEGHAFFDYMRNNIPVIRKGGWHLPQLPTDAQVINASDPRVALPIPQSEIDANPNIVQNKR